MILSVRVRAPAVS